MIALPSCTKCSAPLPVEFLNFPDLQPCPGCTAPIRAEVFPAFFQTLAAGKAGEALTVDSEASCFYHVQKRAAVVCSACGRFLCSLCDMELKDTHYCPGCLETSQQKGKLASIENRRRLHDTMACQCAVGSFLIFYVTFITAPIIIYYSIKHWNTPTSIVRRSKARFVAAIALASLQIAGWLILVGYLISR